MAWWKHKKKKPRERELTPAQHKAELEKAKKWKSQYLDHILTPEQRAHLIEVSDTPTAEVLKAISKADYQNLTFYGLHRALRNQFDKSVYSDKAIMKAVKRLLNRGKIVRDKAHPDISYKLVRGR